MSQTSTARPALAMPWTAVVARRVARSALVEAARDATPADIARTLCGAHAQVLSAAELSIGRRMHGAVRADVQRALWKDRSVVKTFGPRGTVHLLAATDLPMWTGALSAMPSPAAQFSDAVRFSAEQTELVLAAIDDALSNAELTVDELTDAIVERAGPWAGERTLDAFQDKWPRWRQLTSTAAHRGVLCFGPNRGTRVTYTNPHRWLPGFRPDDGPTALRSLVRHYLYAYGPATHQHFARWLNISPRLTADVFKQLAADLQPIDMDGQPGWVLAGDTETPHEAHRGIRLLPYFDAFVIAAQPREWLYPGAAATRALSPSGQAGNYPVVLVDGVVGGVWHQQRSGRRLVVTVEPLLELSPEQQRELSAEVELIARVMDAQATLTIGTVSVGPHA